MSIQKCQQVKIVVDGKGDSKQHAFASALGDIQKKMMKQSEVILRIEPLEVTVLSAQENQVKERFLFFFFPRKRITFHVELEVLVKVTTLAVEEVNFEQREMADPDGIQLPIISKKI